ncbi:DUF4249 domain-containing protein [Pseudocnuella soli]|uniref:DUF4249 domain-containing protein n=1 Tax=Pseudocnuella soli TaxID=2502779 RepID=UPI00104550FC|nr:DUF4249 domain-containing protein [Pseudocnuella soli]
MRRILAFLFLLLIVTGCEKAVDFDLEEAEPKLVVEATIENGQAPVVVLSRSSNFFAQISPELLAQSFVRNAEVYVSNGTLTHRLKEFTVPTGNGYSLTFYTNDPAQPATAFVGALKTGYMLKIIADGNEYTAQTTIPDTTRRLDSIWWKPVPNAVDDEEISLYIRATDRPGFGDYIRYFTKKNSGTYLPPFTSVFDDFIIDGSTYELVVEPGFNRNIERNDEDYYFKRGDTISLKLANIDRATYDFWRTMEYGYNSVGNPFSTPVKVLGNISGGALGYFGGYGVQYKTVVVPK